MAQGNGSSVLTESGRTPLAVLLGDTGELERELEEAVERLTEAAGEDSETGREDSAVRYSSRLFPPEPAARFHASNIGGRIQSLAQEAYSQELQRRRREEEPSGSQPIQHPTPSAPGRVLTLDEDAVANLPWELRRYLVPNPEPRERPFAYGAAVGALIAVLAAGLTLSGILWLQPRLLSGEGRLAAAVKPGPITPVTASGPGATPAAPPAAPPALVGTAVATQPAAVPPSSEATATTATGPAAIASAAAASLPPIAPLGTLSTGALRGPARTRTPVPDLPAPPTGEAETRATVVARARAPRHVQAPVLAAREDPVDSVTFGEEEGTAPAEVAVSAPRDEDSTPPPTVQELDDAFERTFGVTSPAARAAPEPDRAPVFVPAPVAQLPVTLGQGEVMQGVVVHKAEVAGCVDAHAEKSEARRTLILGWVIAPEGNVEDVRIESPEHQGTPLGECVRDAVAGWRFAKHQQPQPVRFPFAY